MHRVKRQSAVAPQLIVSVITASVSFDLQVMSTLQVRAHLYVTRLHQYSVTNLSVDGSKYLVQQGAIQFADPEPKPTVPALALTIAIQISTIAVSRLATSDVRLFIKQHSLMNHGIIAIV